MNKKTSNIMIAVLLAVIAVCVGFIILNGKDKTAAETQPSEEQDKGSYLYYQSNAFNDSNSNAIYFYEK